ncbi:MAG: glycerate kinase [Anaerolineae bacterium]|nr:glycerate kinase [Anaerolineae bacterium]
MTRFIKPDAAHSERRGRVLTVLDAALTAVDPAAAIRRVVRREGDVLHVAGHTYDLGRVRRVIVIGGGKAGASMTAAIETILGERITAGHVNVKYGYTAPTDRVTVHVCGHPVPDAAGVDGVRAMVDLLDDMTGDDLVICLISGGGSALMTLPVAGVALADMQALTEALLRSGAPIQAINTVRKHLSQVKGGRLARLAYPANVIALILSDVVGSPLDTIASGPTVPDPTTFADALAVIERGGIADEVPAAIRHYLMSGAAGRMPETPKAGDPVWARVQNVIVADNARAAEAAVERAQALGFHTLLLSTYVEGEARDVGQVLAALAKEIAASNRPVPRPACLILGGETTVTVQGKGTGGRNQELALAAALAIQGMGNVLIASLATDGTDGPTDSAGGLVDGSTVARGAALGLSAQAALDNNDAYPFLAAVDDMLVTGPTNTNVNDLMAVFVFDK